MKTLLAIGDSHTFGAELVREGDMDSIENTYYAYPEKLGDILGFDNVWALWHSLWGCRPRVLFNQP